ncbi:hypothetical protein ACFL3V_05485 [Nanoarchaeota archaeon]
MPERHTNDEEELEGFGPSQHVMENYDSGEIQAWIDHLDVETVGQYIRTFAGCIQGYIQSAVASEDGDLRKVEAVVTFEEEQPLTVYVIAPQDVLLVPEEESSEIYHTGAKKVLPESIETQMFEMLGSEHVCIALSYIADSLREDEMPTLPELELENQDNGTVAVRLYNNAPEA